MHADIILNVSEDIHLICGLNYPVNDYTVDYCPEEFNGGLLWPRTVSNSRVSLACNSADPLFERGTMTTRRCDKDGFWSRLDLSTCTLVKDSLTFLLVWFVLEDDGVPPEGISNIELEREVQHTI